MTYSNSLLDGLNLVDQLVLSCVPGKLNVGALPAVRETGVRNLEGRHLVLYRYLQLGDVTLHAFYLRFNL